MTDYVRVDYKPIKMQKNGMLYSVVVPDYGLEIQSRYIVYPALEQLHKTGGYVAKEVRFYDSRGMHTMTVPESKQPLVKRLSEKDGGFRYVKPKDFSLS